MKVKRWPTAAQFSSRSMSGSCRIGFSSDAKTSRPSSDCVVERLDAQPVPGQKQRSCGVVPHCEREHSAQALDARSPVFLVEMDDDFGVGRRAELVSLPFSDARSDLKL